MVNWQADKHRWTTLTHASAHAATAELQRYADTHRSRLRYAPPPLVYMTLGPRIYAF
jgi:hypothetical protein